jgi:hypothetical protein
MQETKPNRLALCIMLTHRDHMAGVLLERAVHWIRHAKATIPGTEGEWIANVREWWMQEAQLSYDQFDRASRLLRRMKLIEKRQWWFARRNILYLRPTEKTLDFIAAAQTWKGAQEFYEDCSIDEEISDFTELADSESAEPPSSEIAEAGSATKLNPNGYSKFANPSSAEAPNSKYINNTHGKLHIGEKQSGALPASPACAKTTKAHQKKEKPGKESKKKPVVTNAVSTKTKVEWASTSAPEHTLPHLIAVWRAGMMKYFGHPAALSAMYALSAKKKGSLAEIFQSLSEVNGPDGKENWQTRATDILVHAIREWGNFLKVNSKLPQCPTLALIHQKLLADVINDWAKKGKPSHGLDQSEMKGGIK